MQKEKLFLRFEMKAVSLLGVNFISNERRDFCEKTLMVVLALILVLSTLAACSKKNTGGNEAQATPSATESASTDPKAKSNEFGWELPKKTIEFSYYAGQANPDKARKNAKQLQQYILDRFNDVKRDERQKLMLVSNDYPEVISGMHEATVSKWVAKVRRSSLPPYPAPKYLIIEFQFT